METTIQERLNQVAEYYGLNTPTDFAERTGIGWQTASNYLKGERKPDADRLTIILQSFDKINARWLITGEGEMLEKEKSPEGLESQLEKLEHGIGKIILEVSQLRSEVIRKVKNG